MTAPVHAWVPTKCCVLTKRAAPIDSWLQSSTTTTHRHVKGALYASRRPIPSSSSDATTTTWNKEAFHNNNDNDDSQEATSSSVALVLESEGNWIENNIDTVDNDDEEYWETMPRTEDDDDDDDDSEYNDMYAQEDTHDTTQQKQHDPLYVEWEQWRQALQKTHSNWDRKVQALHKELAKATQMESIRQRAQLLTSHLYLFSNKCRSATVSDWETLDSDGNPTCITLTLDPQYDSASQEADALFQQVRKLKRGSHIVTVKLQEAEQVVQQLLQLHTNLQSVASSDESSTETIIIDKDRFRYVQDELLRSARTTGFVGPTRDADNRNNNNNKSQKRASSRKPALGTPASHVRKFTSPGGCTILVGRNQRGNEHLSMHMARGDDIWMQYVFHSVSLLCCSCHSCTHSLTFT
jgi:predicted ribosome quality control (RQC) complex YloA/Tae2 family protein